MKRLAYKILDVFTGTPYQGNPLAICFVPEDHDIPTQTLQSIAQEFNLSETVFLYDPKTGHDQDFHWKVRIFTTNLELTFAGHPIIGTSFQILHNLDQPRSYHEHKATIKCGAGDVAIRLDDSGLCSAMIPHNYHLHAARVSTEQIEALQPGLRNHKDSIITTNVISPVRGMNFVVTQLANLEALSSITTTGVKPPVILDDDWNLGLLGTAYYVALDEREGVRQYRTRMIETIMEDPATGSMSCALAMHIALASQQSEVKFNFIQGVEMGRESHIGVEVILDHDKVSNVVLKGKAVQVMEGHLHY